MNRRVLFLCSELAGYFANCIQLAHELTSAEITIIQWPTSQVAPYKHELTGIRRFKKNEFTIRELEKYCIQFNPDIVYVAGWSDKDYLRIARNFKRSGIPVICGLDNPWKGTLRQRISTLISRFVVQPYFSHMWVAGHRQYQFARRLGYAPRQILTGIYAADLEGFAQPKRNTFKKHLLFVGRLEPIKGIQELYTAFHELSNDQRNGWTLQIIGNGSLSNQIVSTEGIKVDSFMQPSDLMKFTRDAGGFILPSHEEHWGVVVQEFAAAGLPLLLSRAVNAGEAYLIENYNGFTFDTSNKSELKHTLTHFFHLSDEKILAMGHHSHELAMAEAPKFWVARLFSVIPETASGK